MILEFFNNLNDSVIQLFYRTGLKNHQRRRVWLVLSACVGLWCNESIFTLALYKGETPKVAVLKRILKDPHTK